MTANYCYNSNIIKLKEWFIITKERFKFDNKNRKITVRLSNEDFNDFEEMCRYFNRSKQDVMVMAIEEMKKKRELIENLKDIKINDEDIELI